MLKSFKSYPCVGTVGRGLFCADFVGPEGKPVLFSGCIRVHRVGGLEDPGRRFVFECYGKNWPGDYLDDPSAAHWFDASGKPSAPATTEGATGKEEGRYGVMLATEGDYYGIIMPAVRLLERSLAAEADPADLIPLRVGLVDCWQYSGR